MNPEYSKIYFHILITDICSNCGVIFRLNFAEKVEYSMMEKRCGHEANQWVIFRPVTFLVAFGVVLVAFGVVSVAPRTGRCVTVA